MKQLFMPRATRQMPEIPISRARQWGGMNIIDHHMTRPKPIPARRQDRRRSKRIRARRIARQMRAGIEADPSIYIVDFEKLNDQIHGGMFRQMVTDIERRHNPMSYAEARVERMIHDNQRQRISRFAYTGF